MYKYTRDFGLAAAILMTVFLMGTSLTDLFTSDNHIEFISKTAGSRDDAILSAKADNEGENSLPLDVQSVYDYFSNRHTRPESGQIVKNRLSLEGFSKIIENDRLQIWHRELNASIRVVDKMTGYVWGGARDERPEGMNATWSGIANSLLTIDYFDDHGIERRASIAGENVQRSFTLSGNIINYEVSFLELGISFKFKMELLGHSIKFALIDDSLAETGIYTLAAIYFVPFLGSVRGGEVDGYVFLPDGPGALMRFQDPAQYLMTFDKRVYGIDYGIDHLFELSDLNSSRPNDFQTYEPIVHLPVFGIVHGAGQNAIFATIDKGAEYASIVAVPSGIITDYTWATARFIYRQKYLQPTSRSGAGVQIAQKERNVFDAQITYHFLKGQDADYVGMAKFYRNILDKKGIFDRIASDMTIDIPIHLDVIASDIRRSPIGRNLMTITSPEQATQIISELYDSDIDNISMVIKGWQRGGLHGSMPSEFIFEPRLGGIEPWRALSERLSNKGGRLYFYENPVTAFDVQLNLQIEAGNSLSQSLISLRRDNPLIWFNETYFIKAHLAAAYIKEKTEIYTKYGLENMAIDEMGKRLYAENQRNAVTTRLAARKLFESAFETASGELRYLASYKPNVFLWRHIDEIFSVPMISSQYSFVTDTVPFIQIFLRGNIEYFSPYVNMSFYERNDVLRLIEYGAYPSFLITGVENLFLADTPLSDVPSSYFYDWRERIITVYNEVNEALSIVRGKRIVDRDVLKFGVVLVTYEENMKLVVNYTGNDFIYEAVIVPAQGYMWVEGVE